MPEQYDVAAWRHLATAGKLFSSSDFDDAGYHYGVCGENILKAALLNAGLKSHLEPLKKKDPMWAHLPKIKNLVIEAQAVIVAHAAGRLAAPLASTISKANFLNLFDGWTIDIRYADTAVCPVSSPIAQQWKDDAEFLAWDLLI